MKNVYIITGANRFLGNNIIRLLVNQKNTQIRCLVRKNSNLNSLCNFDVHIYYGDIRNIDSLSDVFKINNDQKLYVIHCTSKVYVETKYNEIVSNTNVDGTLNVIKNIRI